jgi:hypothetical protein
MPPQSVFIIGYIIRCCYNIKQKSTKQSSAIERRRRISKREKRNLTKKMRKNKRNRKKNKEEKEEED